MIGVFFDGVRDRPLERSYRELRLQAAKGAGRDRVRAGGFAAGVEPVGDTHVFLLGGHREALQHRRHPDGVDDEFHRQVGGV